MENNIINTENKKGRFNIVDALIVVIILLIAFAMLWIFDPFLWFSTDTKQEVTLKYVVELKGVDDDVKSNIKAGETVTNASTSNAIGTILAVKVRNATVWEYDKESDSMVEKTIEGKNDIYISVQVKCVYEKGIGYTVNGQQIAYGTVLNLRLANFNGLGTCVSIEVTK